MRLCLWAAGASAVAAGGLTVLGSNLLVPTLILVVLTLALWLADRRFEQNPIVVSKWARIAWIGILLSLLVLGISWPVSENKTPEHTVRKYLAAGGEMDELFQPFAHDESPSSSAAGTVILVLAVIMLVATGVSWVRGSQAHRDVIYIGGR